jgi:magnesium chelatase family protein
MAVCRAMSLSLLGIEAVAVEVEVDVSAGLPRFSIVGLPDAAVQEARERVRVAISNSGFRFPTKKVIVNLAPANLRKEGAAFDLPIALAILAAAREVSYRSDLLVA